MAKLKRICKKYNKNFTIISNSPYQDEELRAIDRGILTTMLTLKPDWGFFTKGMASILPDGEAAIRASLSRLEQRGYITRERIRNEKGQFIDEIIYINEEPEKISQNCECSESTPCEKKPHMGNQQEEMPLVDNRGQLNKSSNKKLNNIEIEQSTTYVAVDALGHDPISNVIDELYSLGFNEKDVEAVKNKAIEKKASSHTIEEYVSMLKNRNVENAVGWLISAIERGYKNKPAKNEKSRENSIYHPYTENEYEKLYANIKH
ncbi:MAG: hypothetical protein J5509_02850 [Lachnospiraceae bacterium]|nr:hypothetical protein [Lachnospiraceae bacterium]